MNNYEKVNIKANLFFNPYMLFFIWLFLVIIPYFVLTEYINTLLKESENRLLTKTKNELINEVNEFRRNLTSESFINIKLSSFPNQNNKVYTALLLAKELEIFTHSKVSAVFYYNQDKDYFDSYIDKDSFKDLGMFSKYSMKNLLLSFISDNKGSKNSRNKIYFDKLLSAAGGIFFKPETATPILSGKPNLGKMIGYYKTFSSDASKQNSFICLFKIKDIPLKYIIKQAEEKTNSYFKRELIESRDLLKEKSDQDKLDKIFFSFKQNKSGDLSIYSKTSDEMLLRLGTSDTYFPFNLEKLIENEPVLKVTVSNKYMNHPLRAIIKSLYFPTILIILFVTFSIIKMGIYGYSSELQILGRVILCVLFAVLLPFASFVLLAYYNQYLEEEFSENEIQQYTQIQTEILNKSIEAYINNRELSIVELRKNIFGLSKQETIALLTKWLKDSNGASLISYKYLEDKDIVITKEKGDYLSSLGNDIKILLNSYFKEYFDETDYSELESIGKLKRFNGKLDPRQLDFVLSNFGSISPSVPNEPSAIYCIFPIFENNKTAKRVFGSVLIKFDTYKVLKQLEQFYSDLFEPIYIGSYMIKKAIIPITDNRELPDKDKMVFTTGFDYKCIKNKIEQNIINKSQESWKTENNINTISYLNTINAVVICTAEKISNNNSNKLDLKEIIIYIVFMVMTLSIILNKVIVSPIRKLQDGSVKIANGDFNNRIEWKSGDEFENLCNAFNDMTGALAQKEKMTSYVSKEVINEVSSNFEHQLQPGGERIPVSVLFCALKGKKELSSYSPEEVTNIISCLIDAVDEISSKNNGQIDKLIEDTVMVVFRQINKEENITLNACKTALAINKRLRNELPDFKINMGIASGEAVSGKIGSRNGKLDYTVIGNPVNLAARLKVQAYKAKNTGILICPNSIRKLNGVGRLNYIERMAIKGRTNRTFPLYELIEIRKKT